MCIGGAGKIFSPVPVDPITTRMIEKAPPGIRSVATAPTRLVSRVAGRDTAEFLMAPIGANEASDKQAKVLLGS
jgi:hypothetical protein